MKIYFSKVDAIGNKNLKKLTNSNDVPTAFI